MVHLKLQKIAYYYDASERMFVELMYHTSIDEAMAFKHEMWDN